MTGRDDREREARKRLLAERDALLQASGDTAGARATVTLDQQSVGRLSRVDAMQGQEIAKSQEARRQAQLRRIAAALKRLDEGEYGYCATCGEDIAQKRLEIDPAAATCINCAG